MGFVPVGARWYLAGLILEHTIEGDPRNVVHVNTHLIEADAPEEAYQKANALGRAGEMAYANTDGKQVRVAFRGLRDLDVIHDDLEDGAELFYEERVGIPADALDTVGQAEGGIERLRAETGQVGWSELPAPGNRRDAGSGRGLASG